MSEQKRIYLWANLRSLSTAFLRAMLSRNKCKGYFEPFLDSYFFSADRVSHRFSREDHPDRKGATFRERKHMLEGKHEGYKEVFVKELSFRLRPFLDSGTLEDVLPSGYVHTFIIRHPLKTMYSLFKGTEQATSGFDSLFPGECSYREQAMIYEYVTKQLQQKPIIIDADDLQRDPEGILRLYCEALGIDYQGSMLNWRPLDQEEYKELEVWKDWVGLAMESTGFLKKTPSPIPDKSHLPDDLQKIVEENMPCFQHLYENRLKLSSA